MEYGINIDFLVKSMSMEKAAKGVAEAGFTMLDYTPPLQEECWERVMKEDAAIFREYGLTVHQTHAPFNRYGKYGNRHDLYMKRCMEASAYLGAEYVVVHGDEFDFEHMTFTPERALAYNHEYFRPYVDQAKAIGCKLAFETVFEDGFRGRRRYTSDHEELLALIRSFESDHAVCCWDFGHANVSFCKDAARCLRKLGDLVQCTHVHDNTGMDSHQIPLTGDIDWKEIISAFREIGYKGVMSIEYAHGIVPESLLEDFLRLSYRSIEYVWHQIP